MQQKNFCLNLNENGHAKLTSAVGGPKHARHPIGIANPTHHGQLVHVCCWTLMPSFVLSLWLPFWLRLFSSHKSCTWLTPSPPLLSVNSTSCLGNYAIVISILLLNFFLFTISFLSPPEMVVLLLKDRDLALESNNQGFPRVLVTIMGPKIVYK